MPEHRKDEGGRSGTYLRRCLARPSQFPCAQLQLLRLKSNAHRLSRACRLVGTDALVAGCLGWALLTTAEVGWAPHTQAVTEMDVRMVSSRLLSLTFPFFIATVVFLSFGPAHCLESQLWAGWSLSFKADWRRFRFFFCSINTNIMGGFFSFWKSLCIQQTFVKSFCLQANIWWCSWLVTRCASVASTQSQEALIKCAN